MLKDQCVKKYGGFTEKWPECPKMSLASALVCREKTRYSAPGGNTSPDDKGINITTIYDRLLKIVYS
jgi:hypothetical protein